jgi:hypothetical protein
VLNHQGQEFGRDFSFTLDQSQAGKLVEQIDDVADKTNFICKRQALNERIFGLVDSSQRPPDPFWMVRYAIIQALEKIGDPRAIPTLQRVEKDDAFLTVRSNAAKAIETLSRI